MHIRTNITLMRKLVYLLLYQFDYFVTYYASIMLNAFKCLLCSKLCWHNRPGPILIVFLNQASAWFLKIDPVRIVGMRV